MSPDDIELEHILLEIRENRGHHLRHFIDQYFCYRLKLISRRGNPAWDRLLSVGVSTREARQEADRRVIVKDHVVPLKVLRAKLMGLREAGNVSRTAIVEVLDRYYCIGAISKREDALLRRMGLQSKMPECFYDPHSAEFDDVFSRYRAANLEFECLSGYAFGPKPVRSESGSTAARTDGGA